MRRTGYGLEFGERQQYLKALYGNIKDKSKVFPNKNIVTIEPSETGVTVKCADGSSYEGDILAGADGVRSKVREEMWRLASSSHRDLVENDKEGMSLAFSLPKGHTFTIYSSLCRV
jgi:2-polyprenyl-6-methoxyphenol hydroxylase-like FAD-dependent oxidoreductase